MLGAHAGSLFRNVVARTRDLGASGDRAPVRQQPWYFPKNWDAFLVVLAPKVLFSTGGNNQCQTQESILLGSMDAPLVRKGYCREYHSRSPRIKRCFDMLCSGCKAKDWPELVHSHVQ